MDITNQENDVVLVTYDNFDESDYLASNPDVAKAVQEGIIFSGRTHFILFGRKEGRKLRITIPRRSQSKWLFSEIYAFLTGLRGIIFRFLYKRNQQHSNLENNDSIEADKRFHLADGGEINYQIIGQEGPWVAAISSGNQSLNDVKRLAKKISANGYRVIIHDRRNCGQSSLKFDDEEIEEDFWIDDLYSLLTSLQAKPVFIVGLSRGNRIAIKFVHRYPNIAIGILLWGLSGGPIAARYLDNHYYGQYIQACHSGNIEAVCKLDNFANLIAARPENKNLLLEIGQIRFLSVMNKWRNSFLGGIDQPIIGISDDELSRINIPTVIVPYYDRMHPHETSVHAHKLIPNSLFLDFNPLRHENKNITTEERERDEETVAQILCDFYKKLQITIS